MVKYLHTLNVQTKIVSLENNKFMTRKYYDLDLKIKHYGGNIACCDPYCKYIYLKGLKNITDYITYCIEIINHEYMHILLYNQIDFNTSHLYDSDVCLILEDRKLLTSKFVNSLYNNYDKK